MRASAGLLVGVAVLLLMLPGPRSAHADIVLHDGGVRADRDAAERVKARSGAAPTLVLSSDILAGPSRLLSANASVERCEGAAMPLDAEKRLDDVADRVLAFELDQALRTLEVVDALLPCAERPVPPGLLARLSFLQGAALFDSGDEAGATEAMARALGYMPEYTGEKGFPRPHGELLEKQRGSAATLADGRLFVWLGPGMSKTWVDGIERDSPGARGVALRAGMHLVQVQADERLYGMWVSSSGRSSTIIHPSAGRAIWADGGRSAGGESAMRLLLADEFRGREGDIHVLQYRGRSVSGATYPADGGPRLPWDSGAAGGDGTAGGEGEGAGTKPTDETGSPSGKAGAGAGTKPTDETGSTGTAAGTKSKGGTGGRSAGEGAGTKAEGDGRAVRPRVKRFRLTLGGGWQYAAPFHYASIGVDFHAQIVGPLSVGFFLRPSFSSGLVGPAGGEGSAARVTVLFVPVGLGAGVRRPGDLSPWFHVAAQFASNRDGLSAGPWLLGVVGQGGIDFSPGGSPLVLRAHGEIGILGIHFNARLMGSVGARF